METARDLFFTGDAAEVAENYELAHRCFEHGAALGDASCLLRLGYMYDLGFPGVEVDKRRAMQLYRRAWRRGSQGAANNIAILYREAGNNRAMFKWFEREAQAGDPGAYVDLAKCYLDGTGVRKDVQVALRCLAKAVAAEWGDITEDDREEAQALLDSLRPRAI